VICRGAYPLTAAEDEFHHKAIPFALSTEKESKQATLVEKVATNGKSLETGY
jgi:hypothetical protein